MNEPRTAFECKIGPALRALRKHHKMRRLDLVIATGFWENYISRIELGYAIPSLHSLTSFAQAYETTVSEICTIAETMVEDERKLMEIEVVIA
jgi:transcriptional regulator with XRE-family HTH domain